MALKKRNTIKQLMAFTLAELLMTMAILGVVAALTIPSIKKYSQREDNFRVIFFFTCLSKK